MSMKYYLIYRTDQYYDRTTQNINFITTDKSIADMVKSNLIDSPNHYGYGYYYTMKEIDFENTPDNICYVYEFHRNPKTMKEPWLICTTGIVGANETVELHTFLDDHGEVRDISGIKARSLDEAKATAFDIVTCHGIVNLPHHA